MVVAPVLGMWPKPSVCHNTPFLKFLNSLYSLLPFLLSPTGAGADFVMLGGMFAGHDQSGGEIIERDGKKYKLFYGMSSATAMHKHSGGVKDYRQADSQSVGHFILHIG